MTDIHHDQHRLSTLKTSTLIALTTLGLMVTLLMPTAAQAGGKVHVDLPSLSIGLHDNHHYDRHQHKKKRYRKKHRSNRYYNDRYYHDRYDRQRYRERRQYREQNRWHQRNRYNNYYDGGRSNRSSRGRSNICPMNGYSSYYNDNLDCYRHKDHFHCR